MTTDPPFPHTCYPGDWCGQCAGNRDAGHPENYPGNGTHPRDRTGVQAVAAIASTDCIHLGQREPGASRDLRPCTAGIAPLVHGRSLVVCCNVVNGGEWQLGKECGPGCGGFATAAPAAPAGIGPFKLGTPTAWVPTPPEEFPAPTSRRAVCTVVFGERGEELHGLTRASHEAYARRHGADYVVLKGQTQQHPCFEKFRYGAVVEAYPDGTLCLDGVDTWIHPACPSIWEEVPRGHVAMTPNYKWEQNNEVVDWGKHQVVELCRTQGIEPQTEAMATYFNSGVWFGRPAESAYWTPPGKPTPGHWCDEENWCRVNLFRLGIPLHELDWRWNWVWCHDRGMKQLANGTPYIVHLAGMDNNTVPKDWSLPLPAVRTQMLRLLPLAGHLISSS